VADPTLDAIKRLLPNPVSRIELDDFVSARLRETAVALSLENFPNSTPLKVQEFSNRIRKYEETIQEIQSIVTMLAYWCEGNQLQLVEKIFLKIFEVDRGSTGTVEWMRLGWFPIYLMIYSAGIAALAARKYEVLRAILTLEIPVNPYLTGTKSRALIVHASYAISHVDTLFKQLPGYEQKRVPLSEYFFKILQPNLDAMFYLGRSYEQMFDTFEILSCLTCADLLSSEDRNPWGMPGRFSWKHRHGDSPFNALLLEAEKAGDHWAPLKCGFFNGSPTRMKEVSLHVKEWLDKMSW
jgi:hypothetical protein